MEEKAPVKKVFKKAPRKKVCAFCQEKLDVIDYKDVNRLKKFISEGGKILPRRMSGTCAAHQRTLAKAIKLAMVLERDINIPEYNRIVLLVKNNLLQFERNIAPSVT